MITSIVVADIVHTANTTNVACCCCDYCPQCCDHYHQCYDYGMSNIVVKIMFTLTKGASANLASRLAISVLPHPVGPIMSMFFGTISS